LGQNKNFKIFNPTKTQRATKTSMEKQQRLEKSNANVSHLGLPTGNKNPISSQRNSLKHAQSMSRLPTTKKPSATQVASTQGHTRQGSKNAVATKNKNIGLDTKPTLLNSRSAA
jgi:hypothetical protein